MRALKIGYMGLSKASWRTEKIEGLSRTAVESLKKLPVEIIHLNRLVTTEQEAAEARTEFVRQGVDAIILHFVTFPAGAAITEAVAGVETPVFLFANPETPTGAGVLEQNSFCGANMAAHVLERTGKRYSFVWGASESAAEFFEKPLRVIGCAASLRGMKLGLVGGRVPGFYTSNFNELSLRANLGVAVEVLDLLEIVEAARNLSGPEAGEGLSAVRKSSFRVQSVTERELELAGRLFASFKKTADKYGLAGYAIRCWPEFPDIFGIAPCSVMGILNDTGMVSSCEGDILGSVTMKIQKTLSGGTAPFFADLISFDTKDNTGVAWHCGAAPVSLCRKFEDTSLRLHMRVDGGDKKGVTNDFPLKPGRVTLAKLDEDREGNHRMLVAAGTAMETEQFVRGNPLRIKFDDPMGALVDTIMRKGFEHHYSLVHSDVRDELLEFCEWSGIEPVTVG